MTFPRRLLGLHRIFFICGLATVVSAAPEQIPATGEAASPPGNAAEIERLKTDRDQAVKINELITRAQAAMLEKKWAEGAAAMRELVAAEPGRWEFHRGLADALLNLGQYQDAIGSYESGLGLARQALTAARPPAPPGELKPAMAQMLLHEGNAWLKLGKSDEAVAAYGKAAGLDPSPATAYFNMAATCYNAGKTELALLYCDKTIAADPTRADAYFIKGSVLMGNAQLGKNNEMVPLPGTIACLKKYLELKPDGPHAADVKEMLKFFGVEPAPAKN